MTFMAFLVWAGGVVAAERHGFNWRGIIWPYYAGKRIADWALEGKQ